jgi:hypothetical protein
MVRIGDTYAIEDMGECGETVLKGVLELKNPSK